MQTGPNAFVKLRAGTAFHLEMSDGTLSEEHYLDNDERVELYNFGESYAVVAFADGTWGIVYPKNLLH